MNTDDGGIEGLRDGGKYDHENWKGSKVQHDLDDYLNLDRFFTPDCLAQIDRAAAQLAAGHGLTPDEADAELARRRDEWQRQKG